MNFSTIFRTFNKKSSSVQPTPSSVRKDSNKNGNPQNEGERLAKLYRIIKGTQAPTFTDIEIDYPKPLQSIQVKHPQCARARKWNGFSRKVERLPQLMKRLTAYEFS